MCIIVYCCWLSRVPWTERTSTTAHLSFVFIVMRSFCFENVLSFICFVFSADLNHASDRYICDPSNLSIVIRRDITPLVNCVPWTCWRCAFSTICNRLLAKNIDNILSGAERKEPRDTNLIWYYEGTGFLFSLHYDGRDIQMTAVCWRYFLPLRVLF